MATPLDFDSGSLWGYLVFAGSIAGSAVFPPLPSEAMLATAMSLAVTGELDRVLMCMATTAGAMAGTRRLIWWAVDQASVGRRGPSGARRP